MYNIKTTGSRGEAQSIAVDSVGILVGLDDAGVAIGLSWLRVGEAFYEGAGWDDRTADLDPLSIGRTVLEIAGVAPKDDPPARPLETTATGWAETHRLSESGATTVRTHTNELLGLAYVRLRLPKPPFWTAGVHALDIDHGGPCVMFDGEPMTPGTARDVAASLLAAAEAVGRGDRR